MLADHFKSNVGIIEILGKWQKLCRKWPCGVFGVFLWTLPEFAEVWIADFRL